MLSFHFKEFSVHFSIFMKKGTTEKLYKTNNIFLQKGDFFLFVYLSILLGLKVDIMACPYFYTLNVSMDKVKEEPETI